MKKEITLADLSTPLIKFGGLILNVIAILISIFGIISGDEVKKWLFGILLCSYILIMLCVILTYSIILISRKEVNDSKNALESLKEFDKNALELLSKFNDNIIIFNKNMIRRTQYKMTLISIKSDNFIQSMEFMKEKFNVLKRSILTEDITVSVFEEEFNKSNKNYTSDLYRHYNDYLKSIIEDTKKILEESLTLKGYQLPVAITLKLLSKVLIDTNNRNEVKVFTAFRNYEVYIEHIREVGEKDFAIDLNTDFSTCLFKDYFIKNNVKKTDKDYSNEHTDFDQYYNCTITVPIRLDCEGVRNFFGYLCCDVLNKEYGDETIFDGREANILSLSAFNIAMFLDNINGFWEQVLGRYLNVDFNDFIYTSFYEKRGKS